MEEKRRLQQFIGELNSCIAPNYEAIDEIFNTEYGYPALDPVRDEICKCFICGQYQSTITLTNHLLEKSLKFCLGIKYTLENRKEGVEFHEMFIDGINKYDNLNLDDTINRACTQNLISKDQKRTLKDFKDTFRNPYSHANTEIFKNKTISGKMVSVADLEVGLHSFFEKCFDRETDVEIPIKNLPLAQGISQVLIAKDDCLPYFSEVDSIIRDMLLKVTKK